jgi:3-deoxy-D-manno-octulosonic-acid transferase
MAPFLYLLGLKFYLLGIYLSAIFGNTKARKWLKGRYRMRKQLAALPKGQQRIWVHCASLGEYEQARPIIDALERSFPEHVVLLTFFSPSGYEQVVKRNAHKQVLYLPLDSPGNARRFVAAVAPSLAVFVKYENWYYYLRELNKQNIPAVLVSAVFRPEQVFFRWYGGLFRKMLGFYRHIFVQDKASVEQL